MRLYPCRRWWVGNRCQYMIALGIKSTSKLFGRWSPQDTKRESVPLATILTVPATDLMNLEQLSPIEKPRKSALHAGSFIPSFFNLTPTYTYTLTSVSSSACGIADTFMHILEQHSPFQGKVVWWIGCLRATFNLLDITPGLDPKQRRLWQSLRVYAFSHLFGLNYSLAMGVEEDWLTHQIVRRANRALAGVTRGASLMMLPCRNACDGWRKAWQDNPTWSQSIWHHRLRQWHHIK